MNFVSNPCGPQCASYHTHLFKKHLKRTVTTGQLPRSPKNHETSELEKMVAMIAEAQKGFHYIINMYEGILYPKEEYLEPSAQDSPDFAAQSKELNYDRLNTHPTNLI
jgi:hypothetical protein